VNELIVFILITAWSLWLLSRPIDGANKNSDLVQGHLKRLWQDAYQNLTQNNVARAERSLLALLKLDEKNVGAYNRLGIIYARQGLKKEAIECFEISNSLNPSASSLHNLALVYFGDGQYQKAAHTFEHAIEKDPENVTRYIALAKTLEKMGDPKSALKELERAHKVDPGSAASALLAKAYEDAGAQELCEQVKKEADQLKAIKA
jgi:Tfp pilus assembly protein PilF